MNVGQIAVYSNGGSAVSSDPRKISKVTEKQVEFERGRDGYAYPRKMSKEDIIGVFDAFEQADAALHAAKEVERAALVAIVEAEKTARDLRYQMSVDMRDAVRSLAVKP